MTTPGRYHGGSLERTIKSMVPLDLKIRIVSWLASARMGALLKRMFRFPWSGIRIELAALNDKTAAMVFFGFWESAETRLARRNVPRGATIVELGSSIGAMLATLQRFNDPARYFAIEANPQTISILRRTLELQPAGRHISLLNLAIDYEDRETVAFACRSANDSRVAHPEDEGVPMIEVQARSLSQVLAANGIDWPFVLISDIEGAEADIFARDQAALAGCSMLVCELEKTSRYSVDDQIANILKSGLQMRERYGNVFCFSRPPERP